MNSYQRDGEGPGDLRRTPNTVPSVSLKHNRSLGNCLLCCAMFPQAHSLYHYNFYFTQNIQFQISASCSINPKELSTRENCIRGRPVNGIFVPWRVFWQTPLESFSADLQQILLEETGSSRNQYMTSTPCPTPDPNYYLELAENFS